MRKKIIYSFLILLSLFMIAGCGKEANNTQINSGSKDVVTVQGEKFELNSTRDLVGIHYKENYVDFHTDQVGNYRTMTYNPNNELAFEVRVLVSDNQSDSELKAIVETKYGAKEQSKTINGLKYIYYEYVDDGVQIHHYMYVFNSKVYSIGFFLGKEPGNIEDVFMNNVKFE